MVSRERSKQADLLRSRSDADAESAQAELARVMAQFPGAAAFVQDVTERHAAITALATSEARYRLAVDATQLGTWSWDVGSDVASFDDRVRELLGLAEGNARSRASVIDTRIHPNDRERLNASLMRAADPAGDGRFQGEYRIVHEDGTER